MSVGPDATSITGPGAGFGYRRNRLFAVLGDFARSQPLGAAGACVLTVVVLAAIFAPYVAPYPPFENHPKSALKGPSAEFWLGTDRFGRDTFSRAVYGARVSLQVGVLATLVAVLISTSLGVTSAYFRGIWDYLVGRCVEVVQSIPFLVLILPLTIIFGVGLYSVAVVLGALIGIVSSRVLRGATLSVMAQPYVEVARAMGCSDLRIIRHHLLPNVFPLVIVIASINVGSVILAEAGLSFLGYGVNTTTNVSWGAMLSGDGRRFMVVQPWLFIAPTAALAIVIFSINMLGDALRDKLDPRLRGVR